MQPQAPANPAETLAKVPRMEAMEPTTWGLFWGPRHGAERRGDLLVPLHWYSSQAIDRRRAEYLHAAQHSTAQSQRRSVSSGEVAVSDFPLPAPAQWDLVAASPRLGFSRLGI